MTRLTWASIATTTVLVMAVATSGKGAARESAGTVKEFAVVAERYKFTPDHFVVNEGDTVRITIRSADGTHGFAIKKLKVEASVPKGGQPTSVEFVADKPGSYAVTCSEYCGRGHSTMKAVLDVVPADPGAAR